MSQEMFNTVPIQPPGVLILADGDDTYQDLARVVLEREGYEVICVNSDAELREAVKVSSPDLVVLEYMLPGMRVEETLARIRAKPRNKRLPVLMVTSVDSADVKVRAMDLGVDGWLTKPYETKVMLAHVRSLVRMKRLNDETENFESVLASLSSAVEAKDPYTRGHSERVSALSTLVAAELGMDEQEQLLLRRAGLVHDIGKLVVDLSFINKPGKLEAAEWEIMKTHPEAGARICAPLKIALPLIPMVRYHHEKLNGMGYPDGLVEDQIPMNVRIISAADVYDALTTSRPYRNALSHQQAMDILKREVRSGCWDPKVVKMVDEIGQEAYGDV